MSKEIKSTEKIDIVSEVESLIKAGLIKGYKQNTLFTQNYSGLQDRVIEYLIVVNIAQQLETFCLRNYIQVNLEYPLNSFYNNAFPSFTISGKILEQDFKNRKNHSPEDSKSKRLDIVLTQDKKADNEWFYSVKSIAGIEVKSINQPLRKIKKDIRRLAKAMNLKDEISHNYIEVCFSCFFRRFEKNTTSITKKTIERKTIKEREKWESYFQTLKTKFTDINFELIEINIINLPVEDYHQADPEIDSDYSDVVENTGFINAYMVKITRNEQH